MRRKHSNNGLAPKPLFRENSCKNTFPEYARIHGSRQKSPVLGLLQVFRWDLDLSLRPRTGLDRSAASKWLQILGSTVLTPGSRMNRLDSKLWIDAFITGSRSRSWDSTRLIAEFPYMTDAQMVVDGAKLLTHGPFHLRRMHLGRMAQR